ncbi:hypothetical protein [Bdellovibrio svalbardensis]|uniref:Abnormal spindle-like microcephaly-associated protein ASH domain-containing protein n=1 Tax=Bdellovibrio svalbardensis TaxID=2972972 RepID=A0ABT6DFN2_9BACT|nr:hypothetical protein [Bdellovibrio svalbardensis]MDG0815655.1 hypothetical protein [Bdellovibrio svalbardensis]
MKNLLAALFLVCAPVLSFAQSMGTFAVEAKPVDQYYRYSFGSVNVGFNMYADFTLTANPTETLEVKGISISGAMYDARTNCPKVLNPGQTCTTRVYFTPRMEGGHWGRLLFVLNDHNIVIDLFGNGWKH